MSPNLIFILAYFVDESLFESKPIEVDRLKFIVKSYYDFYLEEPDKLKRQV